MLRIISILLLSQVIAAAETTSGSRQLQGLHRRRFPVPVQLSNGQVEPHDGSGTKPPSASNFNNIGLTSAESLSIGGPLLDNVESTTTLKRRHYRREIVLDNENIRTIESQNDAGVPTNFVDLNGLAKNNGPPAPTDDAVKPLQRGGFEEAYYIADKKVTP